jgi:hypothetical protein
VALAGTFGAGIGVAGPGGQSCPVQPATSQPFGPWGDGATYFLAPGGDMEGSLTDAGWSLSGGATQVAGSESSDVTGNPADASSLSLPAGSSAMSATSA